MDKETYRSLYLAAASDTQFFAHTFFPKTFRQDDPPFARAIYAVAEDNDLSHAMLEIFRGGSKTTQAKAILTKRIAYGISKTMLLVSQSEAHSIRTLVWIRKQVENNKKWAEFYQLAPAMNKRTGRPEKWTDNWICIHNGMTGEDIHIVGVGIDGQTRGLNIDDFRPDFILGDDIADDLNSANAGPRQSVIDTWTGSIEKSLAPKSENKFAKILLLQTPITEGDIVDAIRKDPRYRVFRMPIFDENGESTWPARWSTEVLQRDKDAHVQSGKLRMWMREMELVFVDASHQLLPSRWLKWNDQLPDLNEGFVYVSVDPTPPPKPGQPKPVDMKLDDTAVVAMLATPTRRVLLDRKTVKSPNDNEILEIIFDFVVRWKPFKVVIETILFARVLAGSLIKEQQARQIFFAVHAIEDRRAKPVRLVSEINKWCGAENATSTRTIELPTYMQDIYSQWIGYDGNPSKHDDLIDAISLGLMIAEQMAPLFATLEGEYRDITETAELPALDFEDESP